jgi:hypothetical protein
MGDFNLLRDKVNVEYGIILRRCIHQPGGLKPGLHRRASGVTNASVKGFTATLLASENRLILLLGYLSLSILRLSIAIDLLIQAELE